MCIVYIRVYNSTTIMVIRFYECKLLIIIFMTYYMISFYHYYHPYTQARTYIHNNLTNDLDPHVIAESFNTNFR